jgi:nucleotide-binding universal stress UspA family protein
MLGVKTILHPSDFSEGSGHAYRLACGLAQDYGARLVVLHVARPPVAAAGEGVIPPNLEHYRQRLVDRLARLPDAGPGMTLERRLVFSEGAAATIVEVAREIGADVIVMGTHGRGALGKLLLGNVAEKVLRTATCPVLTVRGPLPPPMVVGTAELAEGSGGR